MAEPFEAALCIVQRNQTAHLQNSIEALSKLPPKKRLPSGDAALCVLTIAHEHVDVGMGLKIVEENSHFGQRNAQVRVHIKNMRSLGTQHSVAHRVPFAAMHC